jgi:hypothetical protein
VLDGSDQKAACLVVTDHRVFILAVPVSNEKAGCASEDFEYVGDADLLDRLDVLSLARIDLDA